MELPNQPNVHLQIDIQGDSTDLEVTISAPEEQFRTWIFNAVLDPATHPEIVNGYVAIQPQYFCGLLEQKWSSLRSLELLSYSLPRHRSSLSDPHALPVAGAFKSPVNMLRRTLVESHRLESQLECHGSQCHNTHSRLM